MVFVLTGGETTVFEFGALRWWLTVGPAEAGRIGFAEKKFEQKLNSFFVVV